MRLTLLLFYFLMTVSVTVASGNQSSNTLKNKEYNYRTANADYKVAFTQFQETQAALSKTRMKADKIWKDYLQASKDLSKLKHKDTEEAKRLKSKADRVKYNFENANADYNVAFAQFQEARSFMERALKNLTEATNDLKRARFNEMLTAVSIKMQESN